MSLSYLLADTLSQQGLLCARVCSAGQCCLAGQAALSALQAVSCALKIAVQGPNRSSNFWPFSEWCIPHVTSQKRLCMLTPNAETPRPTESCNKGTVFKELVSLSIILLHAQGLYNSLTQDLLVIHHLALPHFNFLNTDIHFDTPDTAFPTASPIQNPLPNSIP